MSELYESILASLDKAETEAARKVIRSYRISREALLAYVNAVKKGDERKKLKTKVKELGEEIFKKEETRVKPRSSW
ncbi:MAG: hypothetical protein PHU56_01390 [Candidatus Pacebacteria bacterium]|nr:hypothetical protein [Candidatus Paceibacterota bacterium]